jgi:hypothetical protein
LQVPDGTTAHVRCPACRTVFSAVQGVPAAPVVAAAPPVPPPPTAPKPPRTPPPRTPPPKPIPRVEDRPRPRDDDEDDENGEKSDDRRDGIADVEDRPRKRRRPLGKNELTTEEKRQKLAEFHRAMYGALLIKISILLYIIAVLALPLWEILFQLTKESHDALIYVGGFLGLINLVLGAIGVVLCVTGPPSPGHYRFGIAAIVAVVVHAVLLFVIVVSVESANNRILFNSAAKWYQLITQYQSLSFYLAFVIYPDDIPLLLGSGTIIFFLTGVAEMTRLLLIIMTLSCLAQAAGDQELHENCTRMAGRIALIPGALAIGTMLSQMLIIELGLMQVPWMMYLIYYVTRGIVIVEAVILTFAMHTAGDVVDVCESPYDMDVGLGGTSESF